MKYLILDIFLLIAIAVMGTFICREFFAKKELQTQIRKLQSVEMAGKPKKTKQVVVELPESQAIQKEFLDRLGEEMVQQEEISRVLSNAKSNLETLEAFRKAGMGGGMAATYITPDNCENYWKSVDLQIQNLQNEFQRLQKFVDVLPLEQLGDEDGKIVQHYLEVCAEWANSAYDPDLPVENKVAVYAESFKIYGKFYGIIETLFKETFKTEQMMAYEKMRDSLLRGMALFDKSVGTFYYGFNGKKYKIRVPEEPYFDPEEPDDVY